MQKRVFLHKTLVFGGVKMKRVLLVVFIVCLISVNSAYAAVIDSDRLPSSGKWSPGIPGGIPNRTTICATIETTTQGDDTSAIQSAINSCGTDQVVKLGSGTFTVSSGIRLKDNVVLRGSGVSNTTFHFTASAGTNPIITFHSDTNSYTNNTNISSGHTKGSTSIVVASASGYSVGDYALVSQTDGDMSRYITSGGCTWAKRSGRSQGQIVQIETINGTTITFTPSLYYDYSNASFDPELSLIGGGTSGWTEYAGLEEMYIYRQNGNNQQGAGINMSQTAYSWIKNIEIYRGYGHIVRVHTGFRNIIFGSYIHHAWGYTSGATSYGISLREYSTDNLVENNRIFYFNNGIFIENAGSGNVVAYNFIDGIWLDQAGSYNWQVPDFGDHCANNHMDLFEGNMTTKTKLDNVHSSTVTYWLHFREHLDADTGFADEPSHPYNDARNLTAANLDNGRYVSFVGSVLGQASQYSASNAYECKSNCDSSYGTGVYVTYRCRRGTTACNDDVFDTLFRHGNVDYISVNGGTIRWEAGYDQTLPNSYYLSSKPSWWDDDSDSGNCRPWPSIGPDVSGYVVDIPAKDRYEGETYSGTPCAGPSAPVNLRIVP